MSTTGKPFSEQMTYKKLSGKGLWLHVVGIRRRGKYVISSARSLLAFVTGYNVLENLKFFCERLVVTGNDLATLVDAGDNVALGIEDMERRHEHME